MVNYKNTNSVCGDSDWALNTAKDYTGTTCGSTAYAITNTSAQGLYNLVGNNLFLGTLNTTGFYPTIRDSSNMIALLEDFPEWTQAIIGDASSYATAEGFLNL